MNETSYLEIAQSFLNQVFQGEMDEALSLCAENAHFIGSRPQPSNIVSTYGTFKGSKGALELFSNFAEMLEPGDFNIDQSMEASNHVIMYGTLKHVAIKTGRDFASDWALIIKFNSDRKIVLYHFYEDTASLEWSLGLHNNMP